MRTAREVTLPLQITPDAPASLPAQLVSQLRTLLADGVLRPGDALPSTRALASHLAISRGSVVTAYDQLLAEGWFDAAPGGSTRVNPRLHEVHPEPLGGRRPVNSTFTPDSGHVNVLLTPARGVQASPTSQPGPHQPIDLRPGRPSSDGVVGPEWRSAWRRAADAGVDDDLDPLGYFPLREAISEHLRTMRALIRDPDDIAITAGGREGLALLLAATGAKTVGVEDPGYPSLRRVLDASGVTTRPLPADNRGLVTDQLPDAAPDLVIVTPSHQYPLGGSLPIDRRQELLAWANRHRVILVEDDYDSELRYTSAPLPALAALDAEGRVGLLGTFAKTLTPALSTGFVVLPASLIGPVAATRQRLGQPVNLVTQRALSFYLQSDALARHTQRMRRLYRRRRALVVKALRDLDGVRVHPMDGGLHAVVEHERDEASVIETLARRGVIVSALSDYWAGSTARTGLVFGFGHVSDADLTLGLDAIRGALASDGWGRNRR